MANSSAPARARLFVALDLPAAVRDELTAWGQRCAARWSGLRGLRAADLHATLCFLGWRDEREVASIGALTTDCAAPVGGLSLGSVTWLPGRRARVLAVELVDGDGALASLQLSVAGALERGAGFIPEARPFLPHVTVARVHGGARAPGRREREGVEPPGVGGGGGFAGAALTLYRSRLGPQGARYEPLARAPL